MLITPFLEIELNATPNGNPTKDFYWKQKFSFLNVVQSNISSRPIVSHRSNLFSLTEKYEQPGYVKVRIRSSSYIANLIST